MAKKEKMQPKAFPNIIFDLGGVLLNLDIARTIRAFSTLTGKDFTQWYSQNKQKAFFTDFETGKITPDEFRQILRQELQAPLSDAEIDHCWNAMLLDLPIERLQLLEQLKSQKRIFLLSNTNAIHKAAFEKIIQTQHGIASLSHFFEQDYYSHLLGMCKPHPEVFHYILETHGLEAKETLFIDDSIQHVEGAKKAGLQAIHLTGNTDIVRIFN
ncbi:MAG: HAD family phosphatase [Cytophagales bacterium]|nr:HAD family phosphatase [Bernardetiaceae bacterium]MDW8203460.1 HAD family phosphatase [Cytophagales bacterium]